MAIDAACKALGGWRLWQCELFVTLEPCPMQRGHHKQPPEAGRLRPATPRPHCCGGLTDLFALPFNHHPVIESGLMEAEAQALLQEFFVMLREKGRKITMNKNVLITGGSRGIGRGGGAGVRQGRL